VKAVEHPEVRLMRVLEKRLAVPAVVALTLALVLASGCTSDGDEGSDAGGTDTPATEQGGGDDATGGEGTQDGGDDSGAAEAATLSWVDVELTDVETGETFRVSDFAGEAVFVESFAVW
jgi:hypothetical protein